jgi:hypothetical protein
MENMMNNQVMELDYLTDDVFSFLRENNLMDLKLKLLFFLARHPKTKFNLDCIANVLPTTRHNMQIIITEFIQAGIIKGNSGAIGYSNYSLNMDYSFCDCIIKLASLDWRSLKNMELKLINQPVYA